MVKKNISPYNVNPGLINPKRLFNWEDTIYVPYWRLFGGYPLINKPWFINPGLTLYRDMVFIMGLIMVSWNLNGRDIQVWMAFNIMIYIYIMFIMGCVMGFTMGYWTDKHDFAGCRWWTTQRWTMLAEWRAWISSNFHWLKVQEGCSWMYLTPMIVVYCYLKIQLYLSVHLSRYMILHDIWWRRRTSSHSSHSSSAVLRLASHLSKVLQESSGL